MVAILADVHIAESLVKDNILKRDSFRFDTIENYYASIFNIHEVSEGDFSESLQYYMANPVDLEAIYADVEEKLQEYSKIETPSPQRNKKQTNRDKK